MLCNVDELTQYLVSVSTGLSQTLSQKTVDVSRWNFLAGYLLKEGIHRCRFGSDPDHDDPITGSQDDSVG